MNRDYIETKIYIKSWHNLAEQVTENIIQDILPQVIQNGEYRLLPYGDSNEFYSENSLKKKILETEVYSIPLSKCYYDVIFGLITTIINNATSGKNHKTDKLILVFGGCKVNKENIDIYIGIGTIEE